MGMKFDASLADRLPLAESIFRLLDYALPDDLLQAIYQEHRGRSYERVLTFPLCVHLIAEALLQNQGSAHHAFHEAREAGRLNASNPAIYGKIGRTPIAVSLATFDLAAKRLREVADQQSAESALPASLTAHQVLVIDGKKLKYVKHKLKILRGLNGNIFGGKLLVAQDMATRQAVAIEADEDGEAADNPLLPGLCARVRAQGSTKPRLWVADRAFCDYNALPQLGEHGDSFAVRFKKCCKLQANPEIPSREGVDRQGREFEELWGALGKGKLPVRVIRVKRPGNEPFELVTNLLDADRYPADDLLELYRGRWGIEAMFQQVVQTFQLRHLIGGRPEATILQAALCFLLYNITLMVRDIVATETNRQADEISLKKLFADMMKNVGTWLDLIEVPRTVELLSATPTASAEQLHARLRKILKPAWKSRWTKAPPRKHSPRTRSRAYLRGGHSSVAKILKGEHKEIPHEQE